MAKTSPRALSYATFQRQIDRQIAIGLPAEIAREAARGRKLVTVNGVPTYVSVDDAPTYKEAAAAIRSLPAADRDEAWNRYDNGTSSYPVNSPRPATKTTKGASDAQKNLIAKLFEEKEFTKLSQDVIDDIQADWRKTRKLIDMLLAAPRKPRQPIQVEAKVEAPAAPARLNFSEIADGNYAVRQDGVVKFYRVSTSKKGFKNVQVRASDALFMQYGKAGIAILHRIVEAGLAESQMLFATELGRCWMCGKTLTDEASRARGMGPDCASK